MQNNIHPNEVNLVSMYSKQFDDLMLQAMEMGPRYVEALEIQRERQQKFIKGE
jgi:hypothetical protein